MRLTPFITAVLFLFAASASRLDAGVYADFLYAQAGIFEPYSPYNTWIIGASAEAYGTDPHLSGVSDADFIRTVNKSRNGFDFQNNGNHAVLDAFWDHYVDGKIDGEAYGYMFFSFIVDVDTRYSLSGLYETIGAAASYQYLEFYEESFSTSNSTKNRILTTPVDCTWPRSKRAAPRRMRRLSSDLRSEVISETSSGAIAPASCGRGDITPLRRSTTFTPTKTASPPQRRAVFA
jgi:hypothetical protein